VTVGSSLNCGSEEGSQMRLLFYRSAVLSGSNPNLEATFLRQCEGYYPQSVLLVEWSSNRNRTSELSEGVILKTPNRASALDWPEPLISSRWRFIYCIKSKHWKKLL